MIANDLIIFVLLTVMGVTGIALARLRDLFAITMLSGIFTLTAASIYVVMDAVDVAFTEASVGAGISTVLLLAVLGFTSPAEKIHPRRPWGALFIVVVTGALLVYATLDMAPYGDPAAIPHSHIAPYYIERSLPDTTVPNIVTAVLASYRGYDTLGETVVIFTAAAGVLALIGGTHKQRSAPTSGRTETTMREKMILRVIAKLLIPAILLFALYVQFHGDFGPGGGFQAGVIFGSAFILYALIFGMEVARKTVPSAVTRPLLAIGVLIYGGTGLAAVLLGGLYLDYGVLAASRPAGQHLGIFMVELGVGITVSAAMTTIFFVFAGREPKTDAPLKSMSLASSGPEAKT
jgi:multicomponent Na+:H+ antiporter subunit B